MADYQIGTEFAPDYITGLYGTNTKNNNTDADIIGNFVKDQLADYGYSPNSARYKDLEKKYRRYLNEYADEMGWTDQGHIPIVGFDQDIVDQIIRQKEREEEEARLNAEQARRKSIFMRDANDLSNSMAGARDIRGEFPSPGYGVKQISPEFVDMPLTRRQRRNERMQARGMRNGGVVMNAFLDGFRSGGKLIRKKW